MYVRIIVLAVVALSLAACLHRPPAETSAQRDARIQEYVRIADQVCADKRHLPDYNECRWRIAFDLLDRHEKARAAEWARYNEKRKRIADGIRNAGNTMQRGLSQPQPLDLPPRVYQPPQTQIIAPQQPTVTIQPCGYTSGRYYQSC